MKGRFILIGIGVFLGFLFYPKTTDQFSTSSISGGRQHHPTWEMHALSEDEKNRIALALSQQYHYLACGNQAFAFESEDGQYVIKFLKKKLFTTHRFWDAKEKWKKQNKQTRDFASYQIAFDQLLEETGLVLVHLNPTTDLPSRLTLTDENLSTHHLNPNHYHFILQRKAELVYPTLNRLMSENNLSQAQRSLRSLVELLLARAAKGIADSDPDLDKNFGFLDGKAVQIDIGRFANRQMPTRYADRDRPVGKTFDSVAPPPIKTSFMNWLLENHPELHGYWLELMREHSFSCI